MIGAGVVVGAPVIDVLADAAPLEFSADAFSGDRLAAEFAAEQPAGQRMFGRSGSPIPAAQDVLASVESRPVDESRVTPLEDLPVVVRSTFRLPSANSLLFDVLNWRCLLKLRNLQSCSGEKE